MITLLTSLLLGAAWAGPGDQVVSLSVTWQGWEPAQPWQKTPPSTRSGYATVVQGDGTPWLLTTAAVVERATFVRVRKHGAPVETTARVAAVDPEADLALLAIDEPGFFDDLEPAKFAKKPVAAGAVSIVRWRDTQLESTDGQVTRASTISSPTGVIAYVALRVNTDLTGAGAAEPAYVGKQLAGIAIGQRSSEVTLLPAPFVADWIARVRADGKPPPWAGDVGLGAESMRSPDLANWLGVEAPKGLLVLDVARGGSACGVLQRRDVLVSVDGYELDAEGNITDPVYGVVSWEFLLTRHARGDSVPVRVIRDRQPVDLQMPVRSYLGAARLIPVDRLDAPPYLMAGGLVFREFDEWYGTRAPELRIVSDYGRSSQTPERRRLVVLASVLPDPFNLGYHGFGDLWVEAVDGVVVDGLDDVAAVLQKVPADGFHVIRVHPNPRIAEIVIDAKELDGATKRIADAYGVQSLYRAPVPPPDLGPACDAP